MTPLIADPQWWLTVVEAPLIAALVWILHGLRRSLPPEAPQQRPPVPPPPLPWEAAEAPGGVQAPAAAPDRGAEAGMALSRAREELAAFKLEVARTYVPLSLIRDVDSRLSRQLLRIEAKLDEVARTAAAAGAIVGQGRIREEAPRLPPGQDILP